ncbi:MAG: malonyl-CoA decarboxylase [Betaproteobacteria bacterium]|nr:malonyl-CoA decarboxylase [Betaproteobacteria bacterium]
MPSFFNKLIRSIAERGRVLLSPRLRAVVARRDRVAKLSELCHALLIERGEPSSAALAMEIVAAYSALDDAGRAEFFDCLEREFSPDSEAVMRAIEAYRANPDGEMLAALAHAVEAPRQELLRRINMAPGGTAALVEMRGLVLQQLPARPRLRPVEADFVHLLRSWFNRGFISLQRIDWRTPAHILEKLIRYEAVHAINGWDDLRRRLAADRRCFAFFHPSLPDDPLIFVEVALVRGLAAKIHELLDPASEVVDPERADTAIFYSISDCQAGLHGISFGDFLIKQVAGELHEELPKVKTFSTLSPVPGFRAWLDANIAQLAAIEGKSELAAWVTKTRSQTARRSAAPGDEMREILQRLCAHYLTRARRGDGQPLDAVARFHLRNGARLERINWGADPSSRGLTQSAGMMVNYLYELDEVELNHEAYVNEGRMAVSRRVESLARALRWPEDRAAEESRSA